MTVVATALSEDPRATHAVGEVVGHMLEVGGPRPDLLVVCVSDAHLAVLEDVNAAIHRLL
ncbi:MAG: hypothetical protein JST64_07425, partial [Actinobacteria bacterium]|nr:hypothetical protein [Actinomycetota bacterium]